MSTNSNITLKLNSFRFILLTKSKLDVKGGVAWNLIVFLRICCIELDLIVDSRYHAHSSFFLLFLLLGLIPILEKVPAWSKGTGASNRLRPKWTRYRTFWTICLAHERSYAGSYTELESITLLCISLLWKALRANYILEMLCSHERIWIVQL